MNEAQPDAPASGASRLFDLRVLIGGLFTLYGVVLTVAGFLVSDEAMKKASGINIDLWMGLGMLAIGLLFLLWWRLRPLHRETPPST
jgi:ABC-type branched-subunit amino acid transport system permease subunit